MSIPHLRERLAEGDEDALLRYVHLHLGDGDAAKGASEVDKAWREALKRLIDAPATDYPFIVETLREKDPATLAHLFFHLHFQLVRGSGEWIHDGSL